MTDDHIILLANTLRGLSCFEFILVLGQVAYILYHYFQVIRLERDMGSPKVGLLPAHVVILSIVLLSALASCVGQNIQRINHYPNYFAFTNPVIFAATLWGLGFVMKFEFIRYHYAKDQQRADLIGP